MKEIINTDNAPAPIGPYNQAVKAGDTLYISGQIAINNKTGDLMNSSIEEETKQVLENLKAIVEKAGGTMSSILKCSIFLKDLNNFGTVNEVYATFFTKHEPARECVEVARLPKDVNVEISAIAHVP